MKAQMTEEDLVKYFNEHVVYELNMLRYSKRHLDTTDDRLVWNAMFAAFNVSFRNLYLFLKGDGNNNIGAAKYNNFRQTFETPNASSINGTYQMIHAQCFHMGDKRSMVDEGKVSMDRLVELYEWVEESMKDLVASFKEDVRSKINTADWSQAKQSIKSGLGPTGPAHRPYLTTSMANTAHPSSTEVFNTSVHKEKGPG